MMQDPDWIELSQEWDRLFQVSLPTIRVSFPGLPTRLVPEPGAIEAHSHSASLKMSSEQPNQDRESDDEDEEEEALSVSQLREKFNIGTEWTEPALLAQRAAEDKEAKEKLPKAAPWVREEASEEPVEKTAAESSSLSPSSKEATFRGRLEKPYTPPLIKSPSVGSKSSRQSPASPVRYVGMEEEKRRMNHRGEASGPGSPGSGTVKERIQELIKNSKSPTGSSKSSSSATDWAFKKKQLSSGRPFLEAPAAAGTIPFLPSAERIRHRADDVENKPPMKENIEPSRNSLHQNIHINKNNRERGSDKVGAIFRAAVGHFKYMQTKKKLGLGVYLAKLQEGKPGRVSRCLVGIDFRNKRLWWESKGRVSWLPLQEMVRIEYGLGSSCFAKLDEKLVLPWNCFTIVFKKRSLNLYADGKAGAEFDPKTSKNRLVLYPESSDKVALDNTSEEVDVMLFGLSELVRQDSKKTFLSGSNNGLFKSYSQLRWCRSLIKLDYIAQRWEGGLPSFVRSLSPLAL